MSWSPDSGACTQEGAHAHTRVQTGTLHPPRTNASAICEMSINKGTAVSAAVDNGRFIAHMATTHFSDVRVKTLSGMVPVRELEPRSRYLHPRGQIHAHTRVYPTHNTRASASCELRSTRSTATAAIGNNGHCIAPMVTTHFSEARSTMPSGMGPLKELEYRCRTLYIGENMHIHKQLVGYNRAALTPSLLMRQRDTT